MIDLHLKQALNWRIPICVCGGGAGVGWFKCMCGGVTYVWVSMCRLVRLSVSVCGVVYVLVCVGGWVCAIIYRTQFYNLYNLLFIINL